MCISFKIVGWEVLSTQVCNGSLEIFWLGICNLKYAHVVYFNSVEIRGESVWEIKSFYSQDLYLLIVSHLQLDAKLSHLEGCNIKNEHSNNLLPLKLTACFSPNNFITDWNRMMWVPEAGGQILPLDVFWYNNF